jgi:putative transposase
MVTRVLKLKPNRATERELRRVQFQLAGLYNWAVLKLHHDAEGGIFYSRWDFQALINGHGARCGLNQQTMDQVLTRAYRAHHNRSNRNRPARLKSWRNRMGAIPLRQDIRWLDRTHLQLPGIGRVKVRPDPRFPTGRIKFGLLQKSAAGWYVTLGIDGHPKPVPQPASDAPVAGVDFGFSTLATLSTGEKILHPQEYRTLERRLGQANRGGNHRLLGRLHQRIANARRCRNHSISRDLLSRHRALYLSRDNYRGMARTHWGKSVHSAGIYQLTRMLHDKSRPGGCAVIDVSNINSTRTCSACGALTGPTGRRGLSVRDWACETCGVYHDRDVNAAMNAARTGAVLAHEMAGDCQPGTSTVGGSRDRGPIE